MDDMKTVGPDDDFDIGHLVRTGSSAWTGPSPFARQSRWASAARPGQQLARALKLTATGLIFTALVFASVMVVATEATSVGHPTVMDMMSHVFTGGAQQSPSEVPVPPDTASPAILRPAGLPYGSSTPSPKQSWDERRTPEPSPRSLTPESPPWPSPKPSDTPSDR
jgi:hypothetical protein